MTVATRNPRAYRFHQFFWRAIDWVYPPRCAGCSTPGVRFCSACYSSVRVIDQLKICPVCGIPQKTTSICPECATLAPGFTALRSWGLYEGALRKAIHRLKYRSDLGVSEELAKPISILLRDNNWQVDLLTPVPLSRNRLRTRGYNQSALVARWVSLANAIPYEPKAMIRIKDTISQVGLSGDERRQNVLAAFQSNRANVAGKKILVIDDVTTTGATMHACATALLMAGASQVYGLTLARAGHIDLT